jgi:hypothetical protein
MKVRFGLWLCLSDYFHGLIFDPEDGSSVLLRNIAKLVSDKMASLL